jgi:hypothetical protein
MHGQKSEFLCKSYIIYLAQQVSFLLISAAPELWIVDNSRYQAVEMS